VSGLQTKFKSWAGGEVTVGITSVDTGDAIALANYTPTNNTLGGVTFAQLALLTKDSDGWRHRLN
jgi:hypothetical protein